MTRIPPSASTRFQPPTPVGRWLARPRMDALLEQAALRRFTLIHAPAGFGKSTLAAQWIEVLEHRGARAAWLSLDEDDDRALWFLNHLLECLRRVHPSIDANAFQLLEERPEDAERYVLPLIINAVHDAPDRTVLVLDDWHLITDPRTRNLLARLVEDSGDKFGFIVTSRTAAGLPLSTLRVRDQLVEVDPQLLRFDEREARQFLVDVKGLELSRDELAQLHSSTEGWIAALQLTSLSLRKNADAGALLTQLAAQELGVGDYLAENVLDLLDPRIRDFLLRTSILGRINPELAALLTGEPEAAKMLEQVLVSDLFLQRLDETGIWFRYHHLFGSFLQHRLERDQPEIVAGLHSRAAHWFHEQGMLPPAVDHAILAGEDDFAIDVVEQQALRLVEHSRMSTLLALAEKLPSEKIRRRPWMQLAIAWAYCLLHFTRETNESLDNLAEAVGNDRFLSVADRFSLARESLVVRECLEMYQDHVSDDDRLQTEVLDEAERLDPWTVSVAANVLTFFEINRNRGAEAAKLQHWAERYHCEVVGSFSEVYGECFAGLIAFHNLDTALAQYHWENAFRVGCERSGRQSHAARLSLGLLGKLHYHRGDLERAEEMFEEALQLGQRAGVVDFMIPVYESLAFIRLRKGDREGSWNIMEQGEQAGLSLSLTRLWSRMVTTKARLGFEVKRPELAIDATARERTFMRDELVRFDLSLALHAEHSEEIARLLPEAEQMLVRARTQGNHFQALRDRILLAGALEVAGAHERAEDALRDALPACEASGVPQPLLDGGPPVHRVALRVVDRSDGWRPTRRSLEWLGELLQPNTAPPSGATSIESAGSHFFAVPGEVATVITSPHPTRALSTREREILHLVDAGYTNREIAQRLYLGVNTVKWYLRKLYRTLGVSTREECVRRAKSLQVLVETA